MSKLSDEQKIQVCSKYQQGISACKLARVYQVSDQSIYSILKHRGIDTSFKRKLGHIQQEEICEKYLSGVSSPVLATRYDVGVTLIEKVLRERGIKCRGPRKHTYNNRRLERIDSPEKAYWLGLLYADGYVHRYGLSLGMIDREHIEKFKYFMSADYVVETQLRSGVKPIYSLRISDALLPKMLAKHGLVFRKARRLSLPRLPGKLLMHFVRGFFDGDGYFTCSRGSNQWQLGFVSASKQFLRQLQDLLCRQMSKKRGCITINHGSCWILSFAGNRLVPKIADWMYKDADVFLDRKYKTYCKMKEG